MVINTSTVVGVRCAKCGKLNFHAVSLFSFSGNNSVRLKCDCGVSTVVIGTTNKKKYSLKVECAMCDASHVFYHTAKEIWSKKVLPFLCLETGLEIGYAGPKDMVKDAWRNQEKTFFDLVEDVGFADFFDNPDVMYQVLEHLNSISENGSLTCKCGNNNIDLEIMPDRLELVCGGCGSWGVIYAENNGELGVLKQLKKITLIEEGFILRNPGEPKRPRKQSKK